MNINEIQMAEMRKKAEKVKLSILGYKQNTSFVSKPEDTKMSSIIEKIGDVPTTELKTIEISKDELIEQGKKFYNKYFTVHNIKFLDQNNIDQSKIIGTTGAEIAKKVNSLLVEKSPFDLPISFVEGEAMCGQIAKIIPTVDDAEYKKRVNISFSYIELGNQTDLRTYATYIHEIAHSQMECHKGYAKDYLNKEVITIFIEKLAALEIDPTGEILRAQERRRYNYFKSNYNTLKKAEEIIRNDKTALTKFDEQALLGERITVQSTLLATKLFDIYQHSNEQIKNRILRSIQDVFDGKLTVEELLNKHQVNLSNSQEIEVLRRHI